ncbi:hypothetical protein A2U01_0039591 [Trifolium medium]|uniref:Reverse transcriptase zinc-binding domain-containing protein n=1 Tax=Trifolium medium TaxID=97028 RepID=A0A392Q3B8_9FABA|nr:hypothetical protein [Trifolium medium]
MLQQKFSVRRVMDPVDEFVFTKVWKCGAPSKVCAFSWQLLLNRIQTKDNLCFVVIIPPNLASSFALLVGCGKDKRGKECLALIWNSLMWSIWKVRNDIVFNNKEVVIDDLVDQVKTQAWKWFIGRMAKSPCLLYEWKWNPIDCFQR